MGDTVVEFRTLDELVTLARHYLAHDEEREELAGKSYELTLKEHTTKERMRRVLDEVFGR
jgi:spore maturation protein CgeB